MNIELGILLLIAAFFAWKMKGAQIPHLVLGGLIVKAAADGSIVDTLAGSGLTVVTTVVSAFSSGLGGGQIV